MDENRACESCVKEPIGTINIVRVIAKVDECFAANDLAQAGETLRYWEREARKLGDSCGLLSVLNEELGYYRRTGERDAALAAVAEAIELLQQKGMTDRVSGATIYVNAATTLKAFGEAERGLPYYDRAEEIYLAQGKGDSYEYAALLNNKALALGDLKRYDEAEACYLKSIEILKAEGKHDGEIAVSYINLAHIVFDRDQTAYERVESLLDLAWEYINSDRQPRDANYAFVISKCAPSLRYFQRDLEADALEEVAAEIYAAGKR